MTETDKKDRDKSLKSEVSSTLHKVVSGIEMRISDNGTTINLVFLKQLNSDLLESVI